MQDEAEEEGKEDGGGSGQRWGFRQRCRCRCLRWEGCGDWGKDERVAGMQEWRVPPTCYIYHLPLAPACDGQFWEQRIAVVAGRPFQITLGMLEYDHARIASDEVTPKRDSIDEHRRGRRANFAFRLEHAVSMQNHGLRRNPLSV
ncbi:unnamed protein product, partial [Ectocarpus sp. 12 AP-2014]